MVIPVSKAADFTYFEMYLNMNTMRSRKRTAHRYALTAVCRGKFPFIFSLAISLDLKIEIFKIRNNQYSFQTIFRLRGSLISRELLFYRWHLSLFTAFLSPALILCYSCFEIWFCCSMKSWHSLWDRKTFWFCFVFIKGVVSENMSFFA